MPKISGLGLGQAKKISGLGLGDIKKISGLGMGLLWQADVGTSIVGSAASGNATNATFSVNTATSRVATLPAGLQNGDLLLVSYGYGVADGVTLNPSNPAGFTTLLNYSPASTGLCNRTMWGWYDSSTMSSGLNVPANLASGTSDGGMQINVVAIRGADPTNPIQLWAEGTSLPATGNAASNTFATRTPTKDRCTVVWSAQAYRGGTGANTATWSGVATELLESLFPRCNVNNGVMNVFTAGYTQAAAAATGSVVCTYSRNLQYRDGLLVIVQPA